MGVLIYDVSNGRHLRLGNRPNSTAVERFSRQLKLIRGPLFISLWLARRRCSRKKRRGIFEG